MARKRLLGHGPQIALAAMTLASIGGVAAARGRAERPSAPTSPTTIEACVETNARAKAVRPNVFYVPAAAGYPRAAFYKVGFHGIWNVAMAATWAAVWVRSS